MSFCYSFGDEKNETFLTFSGKDEKDCDLQAQELAQLLGGINSRKEVKNENIIT